MESFVNRLPHVMRELPAASAERVALEMIRSHQVSIVEGETGSGKTTVLPLLLLMSGMAGTRKICVSEPRRWAARKPASWTADGYGCQVGEEIGFQIGQNHTVGERTQLVYMTEGVLLNQLHRDPLLKRYSIIVLDEVHERSVHQDVLMALIKRVLERRSDLKVVIMSATIDTQRFSSHFDGAPVLKVEGRMYPVEIRYADSNPFDVRGSIKMASASIRQYLSETDRGDVLVFMPDPDSIHKLIKKLKKDGISNSVCLYPLYSALPEDEQDAALKRESSDDRRRVIMATNTAETSVTVPGVTCVVDSGWVKQNHLTEGDMTSLSIVQNSQASCNQRTGRAGRIEAGVCYRLFTEEGFGSREAFTEPEIRRTGLSGTLLHLMCMKLSFDDITKLDFLDPPRLNQWNQALNELRVLGAVDQNLSVTDDGHMMTQLRTDPMIGRMLLASIDYGCLDQAATIAAVMMAGKPPLIDPKDADARRQAERLHAPLRVEGSDPLTYLSVYTAWCKNKRSGRWCRENFVSARTLWQARDIRDDLLDTLFRVGVEMTSSSDPEHLSKAIAAGFIPNLVLHAYKFEYRWRKGAAWIHPSSAAFTDGVHEMFVCGAVVDTTKPYARQCHVIDPAWLVELIPEDMRETRHVFERAYQTDATVLKRRVFYGDLCLRTSNDPVTHWPAFETPSILRALIAYEARSYEQCIHPDGPMIKGAFRALRDVLERAGYGFGSVDDKVFQVLSQALEPLVSHVTDLDAFLQTRLSLDINQIVQQAFPDLPERMEQEDEARQARMEREERRWRELEARRQREAVEREERMRPLRERYAQLKRRFDALGVTFSSYRNPDRGVLSRAQYTVFDSYTSPETVASILDRFQRMVEKHERLLKPKFEQTERIYREVHELMPTCPLCGATFDSAFPLCEGDHDLNRLVPIPDRFRTDDVIGRFFTDKEQEVGRLIATDVGVMIRFLVASGQPWSGKAFDSIEHLPEQLILDPDSGATRDDVVMVQEELATMREALDRLRADIESTQKAVEDGRVVVLAFKTKNGQAYTRFRNKEYRAEMGEKYPSRGERWLCVVPDQARVVSRVTPEVTCLKRVDGPVSEEEILEAAEEYRRDLFDNALSPEVFGLPS